MSMKRIYYLIIFCILTVGCNNKSESYRVRVSAVSEIDNEIKVCVYPENSYGNIINGASVFVKDSKNVITYLQFNNMIQCYEGTISEIQDDYFFVCINSLLLGKLEQYKIPHSQVVKKPEITVFMDSCGNNVLQGSDIDVSKEIQLAWTSCMPDVVYTVSIRTNSKLLYTTSTTACNTLIKENVLPKDSIMYLTIKCQKIYGDPNFVEFDYYSVSQIQSTSISFYGS